MLYGCASCFHALIILPATMFSSRNNLLKHINYPASHLRIQDVMESGREGRSEREGGEGESTRGRQRMRWNKHGYAAIGVSASPHRRVLNEPQVLRSMSAPVLILQLAFILFSSFCLQRATLLPVSPPSFELVSVCRPCHQLRPQLCLHCLVRESLSFGKVGHWCDFCRPHLMATICSVLSYCPLCVGVIQSIAGKSEKHEIVF